MSKTIYTPPDLFSDDEAYEISSVIWKWLVKDQGIKFETFGWVIEVHLDAREEEEAEL